jgi:hypothetical protein
LERDFYDEWSIFDIEGLNGAKANPSALIDVHGLYGETNENDIDEHSSAHKDRHNDFSDSRAWAFVIALLWCVGCWIGNFGWIWWLATGIHDRNLRKVCASFVLFLFSVLATCHGAALMLDL